MAIRNNRTGAYTISPPTTPLKIVREEPGKVFLSKMNNEDRLKQLDNDIWNVYREAYERTPIGKIARLDPNTGRLARLWREWDEEMAKTEGN